MNASTANRMPTDFDIAICGAGPVGLALAALLVRQGMNASRIALIDGKTVDQAARDPRSIALSYGSRQILELLQAWPIEATPIAQIHVSRRGHFGRTLIDRAEYALPALGYVTRYGAIVGALDRRVAGLGVTLIRPATVTAVTETADVASMLLSERPTLTSQIVVQAEGGAFNEQMKKALHRDYSQTAIVAHVTTSAPIPARAYERFTDEGPLALLPQDDANGHGYALVWCARPTTVNRLLALPDGAFLQALGEAFGSRLGRFMTVSPRNSFALGLNAQVTPTARTIAIGNAAQTLHPVAGQGLNLGLRDASVLADLLVTEPTPRALKKFTDSRAGDRNTTIHLTDIMARIFASAPAGSPSQALLGLSLGLVDAVRPAKRLLAEQMMFGRRP